MVKTCLLSISVIILQVNPIDSMERDVAVVSAFAHGAMGHRIDTSSRTI